MATRNDDFTREYLEAKLNQQLGRRGFLKLSGGIVIATASTAFLAACGQSGATATRAPSAAPTAGPTAAPTAPPSVSIKGDKHRTEVKYAVVCGLLCGSGQSRLFDGEGDEWKYLYSYDHWIS